MDTDVGLELEREVERSLLLFPGRALQLRLLHSALFPRPRPLTVWVWGGPGTGKTAVVQHLFAQKAVASEAAPEVCRACV